MGTIKTIYLDSEAIEFFDKKKKESPDFNLSAFISSCLKKDLHMDSISIEQLHQDIAKRKAQMQLIETEIEQIYLQIKEQTSKDSELTKSRAEQEIYDVMMKKLKEHEWTDEEREEYKQGIKDKKWSGSVDYLKQKMEDKHE